MDVKHFLRICVHRIKSNKIAFVSCFFVTLFLWHGMSSMKHNVQDVESYVSSFDISNHQHSHNDGAHNSHEHAENNYEGDNTNGETGEEIIDIREINSKLKSIEEQDSPGSEIYSPSKKHHRNSNGKSDDMEIARGESAQALVGQAFNVLDNFIDSNSSATYKGFKSMFSMWNPKSSKVSS